MTKIYHLKNLKKHLGFDEIPPSIINQSYTLNHCLIELLVKEVK